VRRPASRRRVVVLLGTVLSTLLTAGAFAFWNGDGAGGATSVLGSPVQLTLTPGTPQAQLSPGRSAGVAVVATNANPYFVVLDSLRLDTAAGDGGFDVDDGHGGCDPAALHFEAQDNAGAGWRVPPRVADTDGTRAIDVGGALSMDANAASACQGAAFTVHLIAGD
jgi:hypothetical protein